MCAKASSLKNVYDDDDDDKHGLGHSGSALGRADVVKRERNILHYN